MPSKLYTEKKYLNNAKLHSLNLRLCLAVAQWIEQRFDSAAGCGFDSRQPDHTLEALGFRHLGLLCFNLTRDCRGSLINFTYEKDFYRLCSGLGTFDCCCAGIIGCRKGGGLVQEGGADKY